MKTMKKIYHAPSIEEYPTESMELLSGSGVTSGSGIGFGGTDSDGTMDVDARGFLYDLEFEDE